MLAPDTVLIFSAASVLLALTPRPNLLYLLSRTLCQAGMKQYRLVKLTGRGKMPFVTQI